MLIGKVVTLEELEGMLAQSVRDYEERAVAIQAEIKELNHKAEETPQYMTANDRRYVTDEFRELYAKRMELYHENEGVGKTISLFRDRIGELENYEMVRASKGFPSKKDVETYELKPSDLDMFYKYSKETIQAKEEIKKKEATKKTAAKKKVEEPAVNVGELGKPAPVKGADKDAK